MKIKVKNLSGGELEDYEIQFPIIKDGRGTQAVCDVVAAYSAAQRSGTACTKTVAEVAGSGRKPWKQKGTGRARAGHVRSPIWRGGGVAFGPKPRSFVKRVSKKTRRLALRKALGERIQTGEVILVDALIFEKPSTKACLSLCKLLGLSGTTLFVSESINANFVLSTRNIPDVETTLSATLNTYEVLRFDHIVFSRKAFEMIEERLKGEDLA